MTPLQSWAFLACLVLAGYLVWQGLRICGLRAVVDIDRKKWAMDDVTEEPSAVLRITRIEVADHPADLEALDAIITRLTKNRLGDEQLDLPNDGDDGDDEAA